MPNESKFWMVKQEGKGNSTTIMYETELEANAEAERLCRTHKKRYYVLVTISYVEPKTPPLAWVRHE